MEEFFRQVGPGPGGGARGTPRGDATPVPCLARGTRRPSWGCPSRPSATAPPRWWPSRRSVSAGEVPLPVLSPRCPQCVPSHAVSPPVPRVHRLHRGADVLGAHRRGREVGDAPGRGRLQGQGQPLGHPAAQVGVPVPVFWALWWQWWPCPAASCPRCPPARSGGSRPWMSTWSWGTSKPTWPGSAPPGPSTSRRTSRSGRRGRPAVGDGHRGHRGGAGDHREPRRASSVRASPDGEVAQARRGWPRTGRLGGPGEGTQVLGCPR